MTTEDLLVNNGGNGQAAKKMLISAAISHNPVEDFDVNTQGHKDKTATENLIVNATITTDV